MNSKTRNQTLHGLQAAIDYIKKQLAAETEADFKEQYAEDIEAYTHIRNNVRDGNDSSAQRTYAQMDTAARDTIVDANEEIPETIAALELYFNIEITL